jgi:hypothetical protein
MHPPVAARATKEQPPEFALKLTLRLQEFHPEALARGDEARLISEFSARHRGSQFGSQSSRPAESACALFPPAQST